MKEPHQSSPRFVFFIFALIVLFSPPLAVRAYAGYQERPMRMYIPADLEIFREPFPPPEYKSLAIGKIGNGTVTSWPYGINCGSTCAAQFVQNTVVSLSVNPDSDWVFSHWSGACSGSGSCQVTLSSASSVTAHFKPNIIVDHKGPGTGTITSIPTGISCGAACTSTRDYGSTITLYATPDAEQHFWGWTGDCRGTGPCTVTMDRVRYAAAWFGEDISTALLDVTLAEIDSPPARVRSEDSIIDCGYNSVQGYLGCEALYPLGTPSVHLTATVYGTNYFVEWSDSCTGNDWDCYVSMFGDRNVGVSWYPSARLTLNVHRDPNFHPGGSATLTEPEGASCTVDQVTADRTCVYYYRTRRSFNVTLTSNPDDGATWNWGQECSFAGTGQSCTLTVSNGRALTVDLNYFPMVVLNVDGQGGSSSYVEVTPTKPNCDAPAGGHTCIYSFPGGTEVTLTPHTAPGYVSTWYQRCDGWGSGACHFSAHPGETFTADIHFFLQ